MSGILALKSVSGNNFEKCPNVRNFSVQWFTASSTIGDGEACDYLFFGKHFLWGNTTQAPTLPIVISEQYLLKLGPK